MSHPILCSRWFWALSILAIGWSAFLLFVQYTANIEARARGRHHLDQQFFSYVQIQLDQKRIDLGALSQQTAVPVSSVIHDSERELFPHASLFNLAGLYFIADPNSSHTLIYRGRPEEGLQLFRAAKAHSGLGELESLRYDPTNGTWSGGSDFALLLRPR